MAKNLFSKLLERKSGFTMAETLIAIAVTTMVITAAFELTNSSIKTGGIALQKFAAYHLAEEGLEIIRNMRDSNWMQNRAWNHNLAPGIYEIGTTTNGYPWQLISQNNEDFADASEFTVGSATTYKRLIVIENSDDEGEKMRVESRVKYLERAAWKTVNMSAEFTDWKKGPL